MLSEVDVAQTLEAALAAGMRHADPFPLTVFQPFSADLYDELISNLPDESWYSPLRHPDAVRPDGSSTRATLSLQPESLAGLPRALRDFWCRFNAIMRSRAVCDVFLRHMEPELTARFGMPIERIPCHPSARLGRDSDGYRIAPHTDGMQRVYTAQVYLAADSAQIHAGTTIYRRLEDGAFASVRRLAYLPNVAFCFTPTAETFHGVEPLALTRPRHNLHLSCFQTPMGH